MAAPLRLTVSVVHLGTGLWCPSCALPSGLCLRGTVGRHWVTFRWCGDCDRRLSLDVKD